MKPTQEQIIAWAREAGISKPWDQEPIKWETLERFAALVAATEREACAKVCEDLDGFDEDDPGSSAASAIRARGQS